MAAETGVVNWVEYILSSSKKLFEKQAFKNRINETKN